MTKWGGREEGLQTHKSKHKQGIYRSIRAREDVIENSNKLERQTCC